MIRHKNLAPEIIGGVSPYPKRGVGIRVNGWTFESSEEVTSYFSYYGAHILQGTLMVGGGYNANEWVDRSVIQVFKSDFLEKLRETRGVISKDTRTIKTINTSFLEQYPLWSGTVGHPDLMKNRTLHEIGGKFRHICGTVRLVVDFLIQDCGTQTPFSQEYTLGIRQWTVSEAGSCLVGSRNSLYDAYQKTYGQAYPLDNLQPLIQDSQINPESIGQIERIYGLSK